MTKGHLQLHEDEVGRILQRKSLHFSATGLVLQVIAVWIPFETFSRFPVSRAHLYTHEAPARPDERGAGRFTPAFDQPSLCLAVRRVPGDDVHIYDV